MDFNRNQLFLVGLILLFTGVHLRRVEAFVLNEHCSRIINEKLGPEKEETTTSNAFSFGVADEPEAGGSLRTIRRPEWLALMLISVGAVLILQSLAMKKPDGG